MGRAGKLDRMYKAAVMLEKDLFSLNKEVEAKRVALDRALGKHVRKVKVRKHTRREHEVATHYRLVRPRKVSKKLFK